MASEAKRNRPMSILPIHELWNCRDEAAWKAALEGYWELVKPENVALELEMEALTPDSISALDENGWIEFLIQKYYRWKYTAPNRYATTTNALRRQVDRLGMDRIYSYRKDILEQGPASIRKGLEAAMQPGGLGTAGASGLLALMFPETYGTVDQFVVKGLRQVRDLPEHDVLMAMNPEGLTVPDGLVLITIMARKAAELNSWFGGGRWSPRKVDMVLWVVGRE